MTDLNNFIEGIEKQLESDSSKMEQAELETVAENAPVEDEAEAKEEVVAENATTEGS